MNLLLANISTFQLLNIIIVMVILFLGYQHLEKYWSYKISKPYAWQEAVKNKLISKELIKAERGYQDKVRFYNLWFQVEQLRKNNITGAFAELGVYQGETARTIHHMDKEKVFYLFDTFEGFTENDLAHEKQTEDRFSSSMFADTSVDKVRMHINGNENLRFKPGFFPDTTKGMESEKFALVHIDADLYAPTIAALNYFYPRINKGGVIIVHDYNHHWNGIPKALNEFVGTIPESLIEVPDEFGSAMIIKNS